jgi:hypothetical protein
MFVSNGESIKAGTIDVSAIIRIIDSTDGTPETGVVFNTAGIDIQYEREFAVSVGITEASLAGLTTAHTDGGFLHMGNGYYRVDLPDLACAVGASSVLVHGIVTGMVVIACHIQLVAYDAFDTVRLGLTSLPGAAAEAAGGMFTRGTGAGQINQPANGRIDVNAISMSGTTLTARDIGASVLLSSGTGTGQLSFTAGVVQSSMQQILGTTLTETAGQLAGGFKKWFDVATPSGTVNSIPGATAGASGGLFIAGTNAATTVTTSLTTTFTGNLTGSVGSVTGAVGSVTGAVASVTGAVGSVTGNVGGNVTGSVGSVATGGITTGSFAAGAIDANAIATDAITTAELSTTAVTEIRALANGTSDSGTTTTMVDAARTEADTDYWVGQMLVPTSGNIAGQARYITGFNAATDTITFAPATTQPWATQTYEIWPGVDYLRPTVSGRTLDVSTTGEAGLDWANIGSPTTAQTLSATTVATSQVVASVSGAVGSVTGAVGSVTGAVASVTGNVGGNVVGTVGSVVGAVGSVTGAVGSVTGNVGGNVTGSVGSLAAQAKSDVNAEVVDAINVDPYPEPGQGAPAVSLSLVAKVNWLYKAFRNKITQTSTTLSIFDDSGSVVDQKATVSDDGTTYTRSEISTGP